MKKEKDNLLLTKAIWKNVPPFTFIILLNIFAIMVDFIVSSIFLTPTHVTCVGITLPYFTLMLAILEAFSDGAGLYISQEKGRGDKEKVNHIFAGSIVFLIILGTALVLLTMIFCVPIIKMFGGSTDEIVSLAKPYLILVSLQGILMAIYSLFARLVILLVSAKYILIATLANMVINIIVSVVLVTNTGLGLAALGIGTVTAVLISVVYLYVVLICKTDLKFKLTIINKKEIAKTARLGFPSSGDKIASGLMGGVINNIIGANLGVLAIGIYSSIKLVFALSESCVDGIIGTTSPLYGVIYGAQDKNGIKKTFKSSMSIGMISTFVWSLVILLTMPVWTTILSAAIIDDVIGIVLLTFVLGFKDTSTSPAMVGVKTILFFLLAAVIGFIFYKVFKWLDKRNPRSRRVPIAGLALCFALSYIAEKYFGIADVTGAYVAGLVLCQLKDSDYIARKMDINSYMLFGPIFFASIGLKTQLSGLTMNILIFSIFFILVALLTKVIGCGLIARLCKFSWKDSLKIGVGMMTRGEVALIVAQKGLSMHMIESIYFAPVILLIMVSSLITPIFLKILYRGEPKEV